jgi:hypothetical protein
MGNNWGSIASLPPGGKRRKTSEVSKTSEVWDAKTELPTHS